MKGKKVLVTGGCGFIGHNLVVKLAESCEVIVVDNLSGGDLRPRAEGVRYEHFDIADKENADSLAKACEGVSHVFHLAALPRVQASYERPVETFMANALGTAMVLDAAHKAGVERVVFASSSSVYGDTGALPLHEGMQPYPMSPYAHHKHMGEQLCESFSAEPFNLQTVCLRFFNVYGPWADPNGAYALVVAKFLEQRRRGEPLTITGDGTQTRDFTHVSDVVRAMIMAAEDEDEWWGDAVNIGGGKQVSVNRVAELIGGPATHIEARLEPHDTLASIRKAKEELGWEPRVPFEEGIRRLIECNQPQ
jgi:UDP-glucose 4-epimerase